MENSSNSVTGSDGKSSFFEDFVFRFESQNEIGLVVFEFEKDCKEIINSLLLSGYNNFKDINNSVQLLKSGKKIFFEITESLSKSEYDFIVQYANSPGLIQIIDRETFKAVLCEFDTEQAKFLLLLSEENLRKVESKYPIKDKAGLIFRM